MVPRKREAPFDLDGWALPVANNVRRVGAELDGAIALSCGGGLLLRRSGSTG
jgi:hypothetical protein